MLCRQTANFRQSHTNSYDTHKPALKTQIAQNLFKLTAITKCLTSKYQTERANILVEFTDKERQNSRSKIHDK